MKSFLVGALGLCVGLFIGYFYASEHMVGPSHTECHRVILGAETEIAELELSNRLLAELVKRK